jgi:hypothetical protein
MAFMAFMLMSGGCGNGDGDDDGGNVAGVTTSRRAVILGVAPKLNFLPAFENRLTNKIYSDEIPEDAQIVVLHDNHVSALTAEQKAGLKGAYDRGAVVALIEPTHGELTRLSEIAGHDLAAAVDREARHFADIYAFNNDGHTYVMNDIHPDPGTIPPPPESDDDLAPMMSGDFHVVPRDPEAADGVPRETLEDAEYGTIMDHFVEWLDNNGPNASRQTAAREAGENAASIQDLVKAQTVTIATPTQAYWSLDGFQPTTIYTNTYFIYALYSFDNDYDYYIIDQETILPNGNMYKGLWKTKNALTYAYWLKEYYTDHYLRRQADDTYLTVGEYSDLLQPQPTTSIGSTSFTTSQSYTIGGSLGFNGTGGTGSLSGSATYSSSRTTSISDMTVNNQSMQSISGTPGHTNARWTYQVNNLPHPDVSRVDGFYPHRYSIHPDPPAVAINTATLYNSWIWRVPNPRRYEGDGLWIYCRNAPTYAYSYVNGINKVAYEDLYVEDNRGYFALAESRINLTQPPRERPAEGQVWK